MHTIFRSFALVQWQFFRLLFGKYNKYLQKNALEKEWNIWITSNPIRFGVGRINSEHISLPENICKKQKKKKRRRRKNGKWRRGRREVMRNSESNVNFFYTLQKSRKCSDAVNNMERFPK